MNDKSNNVNVKDVYRIMQVKKINKDNKYYNGKYQKKWKKNNINVTFQVWVCLGGVSVL